MVIGRLLLTIGHSHETVLAVSLSRAQAKSLAIVFSNVQPDSRLK